MESYKEFIALVDQFLDELKLSNPEHGSLEWYLSNHIFRLSQNCHNSSGANEIRNSIKSLMYFSVDSLDLGSDLSKKVNQIYEYHSALIKGAD